ncbi:MAG: MFS transporter [Clostridia bacterium]|nr:MFS transporter [Clostridia bacterium]
MAKRFTLAFCAAVFWFSLYLYIPYLTPHLLSMGISASLTGIIVAAHALVQMVARFPMGIAASRRGTHKQTIVTGMAMSALSAAIMYWFPSAAMLCVGNALSGYASAAYIGFTVVYGKYYPPAQSDRAMGLLSSIVETGILAAFVAGGFLDAAGGIRLIFLAACISGAAGFVLSLFVKDVKLPKTPETLSAVRQVVTNRRLILSSVLCILLKLIVFGTAFGFTPKLARDIGAQGVQLGLINAAFIAASVLSSFFVSTKAGRNIGDVRLSAIGFACLCLYTAVITVVRDLPVFTAVQFVGGLGYASLTAIFMSNATRTLPDGQKSAGQGLYQALDSLGSTLGPVLIGLFVDLFSYTAAFCFAAGVAGAGIVLSLYTGARGLLPGAAGKSAPRRQ